MKKTKINLWKLAFALAVSTGISANAGLVRVNDGSIYQEDWRKERDQFRADLNRRIEKNKKDIQALKEDAKNKKEESRKKYNESVADLEKRNERLRKKLEDYKDDSKDSWQSFKREFNHDMDELGNSINDLFKDNKK